MRAIFYYLLRFLVKKEEFIGFWVKKSVLLGKRSFGWYGWGDRTSIIKEKAMNNNLQYREP